MSGRQSKKNNREGNEMRTEYYSVGCFLLYSETKSSRMMVIILFGVRRSFSAISLIAVLNEGLIRMVLVIDFSFLFSM